MKSAWLGKIKPKAATVSSHKIVMDTKSRDISQLTEIDEPCTSLNVHGAVTSISPIKKGRKALFFDATLADTTSKVRPVGFSPQQQILLNDLRTTGSPVELTNCEVKHSR